MTDDELEELVRELIDEETREAALEWLKKRIVTYRAVIDLGLLDETD